MEKNYLGFEKAVKSLIEHSFAAMFPRFFGEEGAYATIEDKRVCETRLVEAALNKVFSYVCTMEEEIAEYTACIMEKFPVIRDVIMTDVTAAYEGDPAAQSPDEVMLTYPGFRAISTYRLAHELYLLKIPNIPRMMTEYMHSLTGIDIHPGATIGRYFFIDHGTGVVIGETTTIGEHVKLYQHVTLGAKSFELNEDGTPVKGIKRHPDIGNHVVIYAGATILGGTTVIGDGAVIGGGTWITHSVPAGDTVSIRVYSSGSRSEKK